MRNVMAVAEKELQAYFHSPIAYLVMTVYTAICGFVFYSSTAFFALQSFRMEAQGGMGGAPPLSLNEYVIRPNVQIASWVVQSQRPPRSADQPLHHRSNLSLS